LDEEVKALRTRRFHHARFLDATYLHVRDNHHVAFKAAVVVTSVREDGHGEVPCISVRDSEDRARPWAHGGYRHFGNERGLVMSVGSPNT
jgi:transposase-like protein